MAPAPEAGLTVQETVVLEEFATEAVNCCVWPAPRVTGVAGLKVTETDGRSEIVAVADLDGSAWLVAVMVTVAAFEIVDGAV